MSDLRLKRLNNEVEEIEMAQSYGDIDPCIIYLGPKMDAFKVRDMENWTLKFKGRENSDLYPGVYEVKINIPPGYPGKYPECRFLHDFKHFHVYPGGTICLSLLKDQGWSSNKTLLELAHSIINMVHSDPKADDKANNEMLEIYLKSKEDYKQFLRNQAQKMKRIK